MFKQLNEEYISKRASVDISSNLSASEYISKNLKYLIQENERKKDYFYEKYHKIIDEINFKYLIEEHINKIAEVCLYC